MTYVTEDELRERYNQEHFSTFELPEDARLTPSARQFLIDFHIDFEKEPTSPATSSTSGIASHGTSKGGSHAASQAAAASQAPLSSAQALYDAMRTFGMRLRLLGRHALGVNNELARACDRFGSAWAQLSISELDALSADKNCASELFAPLPELKGEVHPVYFELALLDAELLQQTHLLTECEFESAAQDAASSWFISINVVRCLLAQALADQMSEV